MSDEFLASFHQRFAKDRRQYRTVLLLAIGASVLAGILHRSDPLLFQRFLGSIHPLVAFLLVGLLGLGSFWVLLRNGDFAVSGRARGLQLCGVSAERRRMMQAWVDYLDALRVDRKPPRLKMVA